LLLGTTENTEVMKMRNSMCSLFAQPMWVETNSCA
jgi:hypothetical protein